MLSLARTTCFQTPSHIIEAAMQAAKNISKYTTISGSNELKDVVAEKFKRENDLVFGRDEIFIGNGSKQKSITPL